MKHRRTRDTQHSPILRAAIMEVLDNQIRDDDPPETRTTYERLRREGNDIEETRRLLACVIAAEVFDIVKLNQVFNLERYVSRLSGLPEMPWMQD